MLLTSPYALGHSRSAAQRSDGKSVMLHLETSASDQKIQALRDQLQGEDNNLQREIDDRRRPRRAKDVNPNLVPLLRGEVVPYRLLNDETDPPYGLEHTTPRFPTAFYIIFITPLLGVLGLVTWAILR